VRSATDGSIPRASVDLDEQQRSGFRYQYSTYQLEYSRNLVFTVGGRMDQVFQALIDRTRTRMDLRTVKTILGYRRRPRYRPRRGKTPTWEVTVERPVYDLTIFKLHCGLLTLKIYTKGERVLRIEAIAHNTRALGRRSLDAFPQLLTDLKAILERFVTSLACVDQCFIGGETLDQLPTPSYVGATRVAGIDLQKRMRWVAEAIVALALRPHGFAASDLAEQVHRLGGRAAAAYTARRAAYDLMKFRGKRLVRRIDGTRRYEPVPAGLKTVAALNVLRYQVLKPSLRRLKTPPHLEVPSIRPHSTATTPHSGPKCKASYTNSALQHEHRQSSVHYRRLRVLTAIWASTQCDSSSPSRALHHPKTR
jgi:hypothetical protein